jgi:hypothetical protein
MKPKKRGGDVKKRWKKKIRELEKRKREKTQFKIHAVHFAEMMEMI